MEHLPIYIDIVFILTTAIAVALLYKASNNSKQLIVILILWLAAQTVIGLSGYYKTTNGVPPRFALSLVPPEALIAAMFLSKKGRLFMDGFDTKTLTLLHVVRIPVEITLLWLFVHKAVPEVMTFEGRNFDILCGVTVPLIYYFGYIKNNLSKTALITWNIICLLLLANIVVTAILSAPFSFQKLGIDQPNIALFYFPFVWLPSCVVPIVLFAHMVTLRKLVKGQPSPVA